MSLGSTAEATLAVEVSNLEVKYGKGPLVLDGINISVPKGSIYALLGASGCGKTTLLKAIMGRLSPSGGQVAVHGVNPRMHGRVVGKTVGYMPQETALYADLTISEHLKFFAKLHQLSDEDLQTKGEWLIRFLDLPVASRKAGQLSGGQKRRLSLAITLLSAGIKCVILDEPTVGVDPLLRSRIWEHLKELSRDGVTVIITSHYIEECAKADTVGFLRGGKLLVEDSPARVIEMSGQVNLEDAFLELCLKQDNSHTESLLKNENRNVGTNSINSVEPSSKKLKDSTRSPSLKQTLLKGYHDLDDPASHALKGRNEQLVDPAHRQYSHIMISMVLAIFWRNSWRLLRNPRTLIFTFCLPAIQVILFCLAIGPDPKGIRVAYVNNDIPCNFTADLSCVAGPVDPGELIASVALGDSLIREISKQDLKLIEYSDIESAANDVRQGSVWAFFNIPGNYSAYTPLRLLEEANAYIQIGDPLFTDSTVNVSTDATNQQITLFIVRQMQTALQDMQQDLAQKFKTSQLATLPPVNFVNPVYGSLDEKFSSFVAPGMIAMIAFGNSIGLTALSFVIEKNDGSLDRVFSSGVVAIEVLLGTLLTQSILLLFQVGLMLVMAFSIFHIAIKGSILLYILVTTLLGLSGVTWGLTISSFTTAEFETIQCVLGTYFPTLLLSGVIWPIEAVPPGIKWLSYAFPTTWSAQAGRFIFGRGWGLDHFNVWMSLVVTFSWCCVGLLVSSHFLRRSQ